MGRPKGGTNMSHSKEEKLSFEKAHKELDYYVSNVHSHYPSQGYRTIADTLLNEYGWIVSDYSVIKSMLSMLSMLDDIA